MDYMKLIELAKVEGFSDFEIYAVKSKDSTLSLFQGELEKSEVSDTTSFTARGIIDGKMSSITFEDENINFDKLLATLKSNALSLDSVMQNEIFAGSENYPQVEKRDGGFSRVPLNEKIELLKSLETAVKSKDARIVAVPYCQYSETSNSVKISNSKKLNLEKTNEYSVLVVQAIAKEADATQDAFQVKVVLKYDEFNIDEIATKVVNEAVSMLGAKPIPSKKYQIVIENEAMYSLLGAFSSMFSGEAAVKKLTSLIGKEGQKIMSDKITIMDDPLKAESVNVHPFDDEGVACYTKPVVEAGVFKTMLHNLSTSKFFQTNSTGNGFKGGPSIGARGMNLHILPGTKTKEELISSIDEGLLITDLSGLHAGVNPVSGDFSAQSSGFYIEKGKIVKPVTLIVVSGNFLTLLNEVEEVGSDLKISYSGVGAPSIKFYGLPVSGE